MLNTMLNALIWILLALIVLAAVTSGFELAMTVFPLLIFVLILIGIFSWLNYRHRRRHHIHRHEQQ